MRAGSFDNREQSGLSGEMMGTCFKADEETLYAQRFTVDYDYPVHFCRHLFAPGNDLLPRVLDRKNRESVHRIQVYLDEGLAQARPGLAGEVETCCRRHAGRILPAGPPLVVPGGEAAKAGWGAVQKALKTMAQRHLDRHAFVVAVGGGAMLDMLGLAASLAHRGLRLVRVPTTSLAQCDAGIGVKNGIDDAGMKNFAGTFAPPFAVLVDYGFLSTLTRRDWVAAISEGFKVALIKDAGFFDFLCAHAPAAAARDAETMERLIRRCAELHLDHIRLSGDPFETGSARPLDFGHWSAHRIECMTGYRIGHGQAVAIGLAIDAGYAMKSGFLAPADFERLLAGLSACGLPLWDPCVDARDGEGRRLLLAGLESFREHLGGRLTVTLPDGVGAKREVHTMDLNILEQAICLVKAHAAVSAANRE